MSTFGKIGARDLLERRKFARDYIQDGLIALWDADENVGWNKHEANPQIWKNLVGNGLDMISNGEPIFYDKYIQPTKQSEMFHTELTDLMDGVLENGICTMEVVGDCVIGKNQPKMCIFGGQNTSSNGIFAVPACGDATRVGTASRFGSVNVSIYGSNPPFARFMMLADGQNMICRYDAINSSNMMSNSKALSLPASVSIKRFAIGYRYSYYPDGPMVNGEKVYCIRVYNRALSSDELQTNLAIDRKRFCLS